MNHRKKMYLVIATLLFITLLGGCKKEPVSSTDMAASSEAEVSMEQNATKQPTATPGIKVSLEDMIKANDGKLVINGDTVNALYGEEGALVWRKVEATFETEEHYLMAFVALEKLSEKMSVIDVEKNMYCTAWRRWTELTYLDFSIKSIGEDMFEVNMSDMGKEHLIFVNGRDMDVFSTQKIGISETYQGNEKYERYSIHRLNRYSDGRVMVQACYKYYRTGYDMPNEYEYIWIDRYGNCKVLRDRDVFYRRNSEIEHNGNYYNASGIGRFSDGMFYHEGVFFNKNLDAVLDLRREDYTPYADKDVYVPEFINGICKMIAYKNGSFWSFDINGRGEMISEAKKIDINMLWEWLADYEQWRKQNKEEQGGIITDSFSKEIRVMAFTDEVPKMVQAYLDAHPNLDYTVDTTIVATTDGAYQPALDEMLMRSDSAPDIYALEAAFVLKYTQGSASGFAATYDELGLDTAAKLKEAKIATYASEIGTRPSDGKVVALPYQATGGCFIYRRSVAKDTWGTDDPAVVQEKIGGGSGSWDQFWVAAEELKKKGYGIVSGEGDIWRAIENSADKSWIVDGKLTIDPKREALLDIAKMMKEKDYYNENQEWQDGWFADMRGEGDKEILGFFGTAWLINYTMGDNCGNDKNTPETEGTFGDWAVCSSPVGFWWGGTWVASGKSAVENMSEDKKAVVADIINWITLDCTKDGLQYQWANGNFAEGSAKDTVASGVVMEMCDGTLDFLGGQNMFDYFVPAGDYATGRNMTQYDETINNYWREAVRAYVEGKYSRREAIEWFIQKVGEELNISVAEDDPNAPRNLHGMKIIIGDHFSPETPAEPKNAKERAIWKYRQELFKKYNFTMQSKGVAGWHEMEDTYIQSTLAGEPEAQLFELDYRFVADGLKNNCFYNLATLDELDFSEEKWNKSVRDVMTIGNGIYGMSVDKSEPRGGVIWNKRLFEEAGLDPDLPYDLQISGEWTWSKFMELCKRLTRDVDGDGVTDIYATASQNSSLITCLVASTGSDFFVKDKNGTIVNNMGSKEVLSALDFAVKLYNKGYEMLQPNDDDWDYFEKAFREGKAAMQFNEEYICNPSKSEYRPNDEIGFVMPPKPDGAKDYHSYVANNITVIPSCYDAETASNIAFAYNLYTMTVPEYEDSDAWKEMYYDHFEDTRAVDETIAMFNDGVSTHQLTRTLVPVDLENDLFYKYPFAGTTPEKVVDSISKDWNAILKKVNNR